MNYNQWTIHKWIPPKFNRLTNSSRLSHPHWHISHIYDLNSKTSPSTWCVTAEMRWRERGRRERGRGGEGQGTAPWHFYYPKAKLLVLVCPLSLSPPQTPFTLSNRITPNLWCSRFLSCESKWGANYKVLWCRFEVRLMLFISSPFFFFFSSSFSFPIPIILFLLL